MTKRSEHRDVDVHPPAAPVARNRSATIDAAYAAYERQPLDTDDEWGDVASFRTAAGAS
jgi:hypothetical protein